ncbi:DUF1223 domain-containing protein [Martelella soudanensis]|uniref:DUF1223 domain-containing protein n=1 Tax=unclassified Martelella TaxID=2629616 RepID=UPI0015DF74C2|nr:MULTISPECIES: thioredoxin family protein [unclassified Martelella]
MLKHTIILGALAAAFAFSGAGAGEIRSPLGVVELFTSQGCSSCPPADKAVAGLADEGDVIVLSYHVDYWNYLGWTDTMSSPENTQRQYDYSAAMGRSGVYTPQAVVNGRAEMVGASAEKLRQTLAGLQSDGEGMNVPVSISKSGDEVIIDIGSGKGKADVLVVYFKSREQVAIKDGENEGRTIDYRNIVTDVQTVGMWHGKATKVTLPARVLEPRESDGCAILLQTTDGNGNPGAILGATMVTAN